MIGSAYLVYVYTIRIEAKVSIVNNSMKWTIKAIKGHFSLSNI